MNNSSYELWLTPFLGNNFPIAPQKDLLIATVDVKEEYTINFEMKQRLVFKKNPEILRETLFLALKSLRIILSKNFGRKIFRLNCFAPWGAIS